MYLISPERIIDKIQACILGLGSVLTNEYFNPSPTSQAPSTYRPDSDARLRAWYTVDSELTGHESGHHRFWWSKHTGKALAVLLYNAGYPEELQYRDLKFFAQVVSPYLGVSQNQVDEHQHDAHWKSFMTDDGTPLELSWEWSANDGSSTPRIRYSIEPIGLHAGSPVDRWNQKAGPAFQAQLARSLPGMRLEWFKHFQQFFNHNQRKDNDLIGLEDHSTSIFYAFDLSNVGITVKTYFFPRFRATADQVSNLDVLSRAIQSAPSVTGNNLQAWSLFCDFCSDMNNDDLEHEMLAIDHVKPSKSRIKIYFRSRETTFQSVVRIMSLGGRTDNPNLVQGFKHLARLWKAVFEVDAGNSPALSLPCVNHRTAGLLYNIEFKLGDTFPVAKIYLPVRHYSSSDRAVIRGLKDYFQDSENGKYMPQYLNAMHTIL